MKKIICAAIIGGIFTSACVPAIEPNIIDSVTVYNCKVVPIDNPASWDYNNPVWSKAGEKPRYAELEDSTVVNMRECIGEFPPYL